MTITLNGTTGITLPNGSASAPAETGTDTDSGVFYGTNTVSIATGGTTAVTVDSSQNVGIGTSSPQKKLHIVGVDGAVASFPVIGGKDNLVVENNNNSNIALVVASGNYTAGIKGFISGGTGSTFAGINLAANSGSPYLAFDTNASERMRIDSSGNLGIGNTSPNAARLVCTGTTSLRPAQFYGSGGAVEFVEIVNTQNSSFTAMRFLVNNYASAVGTIACSTTATAYNTSSDYRLKENIAPMTGALDVVQKLKPCTYTWKSSGENSQGFIAHELQEVVPDCVTGGKDAVDADGNPVYQGIDTSFLVATLTAAIQELKAELDTVKTELATLKGTA